MNANARSWSAVCAAIWFMCLAPAAFAHDPSKSYLSLALESNRLAGQWDIPLRDLITVSNLHFAADGIVTREDLQDRFGAITAYITARLKPAVDGRPATLRITGTEPNVVDFSDGAYLSLPIVIETSPAGDASPKVLELTYQLFFDINSLHRGLFRLEANGRTQTAVFEPGREAQEFQLAAAARPGRQFLVFLHEGIWHIWTGYDHILFLLALLLPSVLRREQGHWQAADGFKPALLNVVKIVTAFTLAHSLTLSLAALDIVRLPSRLTESAIAASVALAAANNLYPVVRERGWMLAFVFGLVHGFGFANALSDLGLVHGALLLTLVGFNLGVEIGQLAIVAVFLPVAYGLRRGWFYQKLFLPGGSACIILIAGAWFAERVFDFKFLPF